MPFKGLGLGSFVLLLQRLAASPHGLRCYYHEYLQMNEDERLYIKSLGSFVNCKPCLQFFSFAAMSPFLSLFPSSAGFLLTL